MLHPLRQAAPLQHAVLQVDHVGVLALDAAQGPELAQGQLHVLGGVAADLLDGDAGTGAVHGGLVHHAVAAAPHLLNELVPGLAAHHAPPTVTGETERVRKPHIYLTHLKSGAI